MKKIIAIIGNANIDEDIEKQNISFQLGKLIIDNGFVLVTGGLGGVMEYASKGAKASEKYTANSILGILPDYNSESANKYADIVIPTGLGLARNLMLISMSSAVIAVGGGSGTLNEISSAWQMNKLIIGIQVQGWSENLCGKALDERRDDIIFCAENAHEAIKIINAKISYYQKRKFLGVNKSRIKREKAEEIIVSYFQIKNKLNFVGKGSEGYIFTDQEYVYKIIDNAEKPLELYWTLLSLSETLNLHKDILGIPIFDVSFSDRFILIKYHFKKSQEFDQNSYIGIDKFISLLKEFKKIGWTLADFKPQNLRISETGELLVVDIGCSFLPISEYLFESMCRRAFVSFKLQDKISDSQDFKKYLSPVNEIADFSLMTEFGFSEVELKAEFEQFLNKVVLVDKKDILNPIIKDIFQTHITVKTVFDYGSGYGDLSMLLQKLNLSVTAYDPDKNIIKKYKEKYYSNIELVDYTKIKKLIAEKSRYDSVLCSLVLCHPLAESRDKRLEIIRQIMFDITALSKKYIVIAICNPLYTYQPCSSIQKRIIPNNFDYFREIQFVKKIYSSGRERSDIHRPLSFYEDLFTKYNLKIKEIIQTKDNIHQNGIKNSDFMIFLLEKTTRIYES